MFWNCTSLKDINVINFNTQNVWDMSFMFYRCQNVERLDLSNFNTSNVINMVLISSSNNDSHILNILVILVTFDVLKSVTSKFIKPLHLKHKT